MTILTPEKGRLLIAKPTILNDSCFNRTIILLTEHTTKNAVGFILNKPSNHLLNELVPDIDCDFTVYEGGPVEQDNLYFIHKVPHLIPNSIEVADGIYWGGNFELLKELCANKLLQPNDIRFFLGYSGWATPQLADELDTDSWFISENDYDNILNTKNESFWKNKLLQKGGKYKIWANAPSDIQMN